MAKVENTEPHLATRTTKCGGCDGIVVKGHHVVVGKFKSLIHEGCVFGENGLRFGRPRFMPATKRAPRVPGLRDDRYGRYTMVHPDGSGKVATKSRASTVIHTTEDDYALTQWQMGMVLRGAAARPDLPALAASLSLDSQRDKQTLKDLVEQAQEAGGAKAKANLGTAVHGFCEVYDREGTTDGVPDAYLPDVLAYARALDANGLTVLPDMVERSTMTSRWDGVGGTFDNVYLTRDGRYVIGDKKTGKVGYSPKVMYGQFAVYAEGVSEFGVYDHETGLWAQPEWEIDYAEALIIHLPVGQARCDIYSADLAVGRTHLDQCAEVRRQRRVKHSLTVYLPPARDLPAGGWAQVLRECTTVEAVKGVGREIVAAEVMTDELREIGRQRIAALVGGDFAPVDLSVVTA